MEQSEQIGSYRLIQRDGLPKLGTDALLLGKFATVRAGMRVCDLGCGVGVLGVLLAGRAERLTLDGVERDPDSAALARRNLSQNALAGAVVTGDLRDLPGELRAGNYDLVIANPPYYPVGSGAQAAAGRQGARSERDCTLAQVCAAAGRLLRNGGYFALCHRPERLADVFGAMRGAGIEPKRLQMVQARADRPPRLLLVEGMRQGRPGLNVLPALLLDRRK